jgi:hypothetical protein
MAAALIVALVTGVSSGAGVETALATGALPLAWATGEAVDAGGIAVVMRICQGLTASGNDIKLSDACTLGFLELPCCELRQSLCHLASFGIAFARKPAWILGSGMGLSRRGSRVRAPSTPPNKNSEIYYLRKALSASTVPFFYSKIAGICL